MILSFKFLHKLTFHTCAFKEIHLVVSILSIVALLLTGLVLLVGYILFQEVNYTLPLFSLGNVRTLPLLCDDLSLSFEEDFEMFNTNRENLWIYVNSQGKYICTCKNFTEVISKFVERQSRFRLAKGLENDQYTACGNESFKKKSGSQTASFKKLLRHQNYSGNGLDVKLQWENHLKHSYIDKDIPYNNGEITIPEGQTYFIYASVHINISLINPYGGRSTTRRHSYTLRICRRLYDYEETLLGKTEIFDSGDDLVVSSIRIEGPLQLRRNDIIYVKVSNGNQLILNTHGNTFGLYPL